MTFPPPWNEEAVWRDDPRKTGKCYWGREACSNCKKFKHEPFVGQEFEPKLCDECVPNGTPKYEDRHVDKFIYPTADAAECEDCKKKPKASRAAEKIITGGRPYEEGTSVIA
jgi:hypothetical protein